MLALQQTLAVIVTTKVFDNKLYYVTKMETYKHNIRFFI